MKTVLKDHRCYVQTGSVEVEEGGQTTEVPRPRLIVIDGDIAYRDQPATQVSVKALLDTGAEVTILKSQKLRELEANLGFRLPVTGRIRYYGHDDLQPAFDLAFVFPGDHPYFSSYGFITPTDWDFDVADIWLGQDILAQLQVTFDGINQTVTIVDPLTSNEGA